MKRDILQEKILLSIAQTMHYSYTDVCKVYDSLNSYNKTIALLKTAIDTGKKNFPMDILDIVNKNRFP